MRTLSREQVREFDRRAIEELHVPGVVLMENAGRECADLLCSKFDSGRVVIFCGKGNNGGDGLVIARHLIIAGYDVQLLLFANPAELRGDALINWDISQRLKIPTRVCNPSQPAESLRLELTTLAARADWLIDALLGTGAKGAPASAYAVAIDAMNQSGRPVFAVDIPSGLDCDTGEAPGVAVQATLTATFVAPKPGLLLPDSRKYVGELHVHSIGVPTDWFFGQS